MGIRHRLVSAGFLASLAACGGSGASGGPPVEFTVPAGASFGQVVDSLESRGLVGWPRLFTLYARAKKADRQVRAGRYRFQPGAGWSEIVGDLVAGRVQTEALTIPEGFTVAQMAPRIAEVSEVAVDSVRGLLEGDSAQARFDVPGPGLEGYLLPETYRFAEGTAPEVVINTMAAAFREFWTPERTARADSLGMGIAQITTLASIVQGEARFDEEMPTIAAVYHNRLAQGWPLQADPTVLYALGGPRDPLLYAAMDSVADSPYNTYTHPGLPPGPIGAPGKAAMEATLHPAEVDYMYFVAGPDGHHVFSRTLTEHNRAVAEARRARDTTDTAGR